MSGFSRSTPESEGLDKMKKFGKIIAAAILMSMLASSAALAEQSLVSVQQAASSAPPGSEGTTLSPVENTDTGSVSQAAQETAPIQTDEASTSSDPQQQMPDSAPDEPPQSSVILVGQSTADSNPPVGPGLTPNTQNQPSAAPETAPAQNEDGSGRTIDPSRPMIALTFDDGPLAAVGNQIMDCLAQYDGKATFFMVGSRVPSYAAEVKRMAAEGHEVANHTMNHKYLQSLGADAVRTQIQQCNDIIEQTCGVRPVLLRLPGGNSSATVRANADMPMIQWNVDTLDWKTRNTASTVQKVLDHAKDGDVVLMHELYSATGNAAVQIIPELAKRGFQLVTVSEMAAAKGYTLQPGKLYYSF